ncbi:MAG: 3-deoxy-manno-octulosonate cytidylyltransferase [Ignavibacteria bacterium]|nr:3-deoxy-manno-octulosonate cytidylyltransferase [Ignavibacteria bacterium]
MGARPKVIGVIPARYASQRLPAKPLVDLREKSLVQRVYEQARKASTIDHLVVATDDARIAEAVRSFGGAVMMTSPEIKSGSDRVAAVAEAIEGDIFVNVQGDEPLIAPQMIDQGVRLLLDDEKVKLGTLARHIDTTDELFNPSVVKVVLDVNGDALYFSRSPIPHQRDAADQRDWLRDATFLKHIGLYVFRRDFLKTYAALEESRLERLEKLEQLRALEHGYRIRVGMTEFDSIPVDTPEDVERVIHILQSKSS